MLMYTFFPSQHGHMEDDDYYAALFIWLLASSPFRRLLEDEESTCEW